MSTIKRSKRETPFVQIDKRALQDKGLGWKAKGLLAYLLSLPDDWQIYVEELTSHSRDGRDSTGSAMRELIKAGYITRERKRTDDGKFKGYEYTVFESRQTENPSTDKPETENPSTDKPETENPSTDKPETENPQLQIKEDTNKENTNIEDTNKEKTDKKGQPESGQVDLKEDSHKKEDQPKPEEEKAQRLIEQTNNKKKGKKSKGPALPFQSPEFSEAWEEWIQYRKESRKKLTPTTIKHQFKILKDFEEHVAIQMIHQSIAKGWLGLFEVKNPKPKSDTPIKDGYDALEKKMEEENWTVEDIFRIANSNQFTNQQNEA